MTIEIARERKSYRHFRSGRKAREKRGLLKVKRVAWVHPASDDTHLLINELHGKKLLSDIFFRGMFLAWTPSATCNLFQQLLKWNEEVSRLLSYTTCIMWADGRRIRWIRWWADSMHQRKREVPGEEKDAEKIRMCNTVPLNQFAKIFKTSK